MSGVDLTVGKVVRDAYDVAKREGWIENLLLVLRKKHKVLVLGSSGAGKTQLIRSLSSLTPEIVSVLERTQFVEKNRLNIEGDLFEFFDAPGEINKVELRKQAILEALSRDYSLIINVVAYGYHEYSESSKREFISDSGEVNQEFLAEHQDVEVELVSEWVAKFDQSKSPPSLVTVVSKADIWWHDRDTVIAHYISGDYAAALSEYPGSSAVVAYSSRIQRFFGEGVVSASFDETCKQELRDILFHTLLSAIGKTRGGYG